MNTNKVNHNHLLMCYGGSKIREPVSKHTILGWLVKLIKAAYKADGRIVPEVIKTHSTRTQATSAYMAVPLDEIMQAAD